MNKIKLALPLIFLSTFLLSSCSDSEQGGEGSMFDKLISLVKPKQGGNPLMRGRVIPVSTIEVQKDSIDIVREVTGRTTAFRWAEVRPEVGGILKERCFTEGSMVKAGDVLYRIEPDTYKALLENARGSLAAAEASLNVTKLRTKRVSLMFKSKSVSQQDLDDANAALKQAEANVQSAKAAVRTAEINFQRAEVKAPISGRIGMSEFTAGALVSAGNALPLTKIYQTNPIYVEISLSSDDFYAINKQLGEQNKLSSDNPEEIKAELKLSDGSVYPEAGHLNFAGVDVDMSTNTILFRATFPNDDALLLPGLFVRVKLTLGVDKNAIVVPQKCVSRDPKGEPFVYTIKDGKAERKFIKVAGTTGTNWHVTSGLQSGEKLIYHGVGNVRAGMPVKEISMEEAEQAAKGNIGGKK